VLQQHDIKGVKIGKITPWGTATDPSMPHEVGVGHLP
jgi:hypothetical protein